MSNLSLNVVIRAVTDQFTGVINQVRQQLNHLAQSASTSATQISAHFSTLRQSINNAFSGMNGLIATLGLGALAQDILDTNRAMENLRVQLVSVTGTQEKANSVFNAMLKLATETPFEIEDVTKAYIKLKNFGLEPTAQVMDALTNQVSKLGGSSEILSGVTLALGQAWSKGKLQAEELNQLVERGVPVYELLSKATGKNSAELQKMSAAGELTRDIIEQLIVKMGELASGSNARAMETLNGKISILADSWHKFENALLQDKSEGAIKHIVSTWAEWLDFFSEKLTATETKLTKLSELNERIATRKTVVQFFETDPIKAGIVGAVTGTSKAGEQNRLAADQAERDKLLSSLHEDTVAQRAKTTAEKDALDNEKALAKTAEERAEANRKLTEWTEKYATKTEQLANELKSAKKELGQDFSPALEQAIRDKYAPKAAAKPTPKHLAEAPQESAMHGFDAGLEQQKIAFEREHALLDYSKEQEKAYWDSIIATYQGDSKTLADLKKKSAEAELAVIRKTEKDKLALQNEADQSTHDAALAELDAKTIASEQELELGTITQHEHLANLRQFASERLQIELDLLEAKRALLGEDKLALAQNLHAKEALVRGYNATQKGLDNKEAQDKKAAFKSMFQPFETAMDGMVQGVLTGQQSIGKAVKNAAASILTSYAATFIKARIMNAAEWAWEVAGFGTKEGKKKAIENGTEVWHALLWVKKKALMVGHWLWETLGFAGKETAKTGIATTGTLARTSKEELGVLAKAGLWLAETLGFTAKEGEKTIVATAANATQVAENVALGASYAGVAGAAGVASAAAIPVVGWALAPEAGALDYGAAMGFATLASAKGGEWQVGKDGSPYILHANETVLPAGVADNFRHVVNLVQGTVAPVEPINDTITRLLNNGQIPKQLGLPDHALRLTSTVQTAANNLAKERSNADKERQSIVNTKQEATTINMHGIMLSPEDFLEKHGKTIVKVAQKQARNFNTGKKS